MTQYKMEHEEKLEPTYDRVVCILARDCLYVGIPCTNPSVRAMKIHLSFTCGNRTLPAAPSSVNDKSV